MRIKSESTTLTVDPDDKALRIGVSRFNIYETKKLIFYETLDQAGKNLMKGNYGAGQWNRLENSFWFLNFLYMIYIYTRKEVLWFIFSPLVARKVKLKVFDFVFGHDFKWN